MAVGVPLSHHVACSLACLAILFVLDITVVKAFTTNVGSRWFALHSIANLLIVVLSIPDIITVLSDPVTALSVEKQESSWPTYFVMGLHLAHCVLPWYSASLTVQDYIHHFVFAFSLGALCLYFHWGPLCNMFNIFVCGIPGMVDYALLAMVKEQRVRRLTEKRWNAVINNWLRAPGCMISTAWIYASWAHGNLDHTPTAVVFGAMVLMAANGQYYSGRVVGNHAVCEAMEKNKKKDWEHPHPNVKMGSEADTYVS